MELSEQEIDKSIEEAIKHLEATWVPNSNTIRHLDRLIKVSKQLLDRNISTTNDVNL